MAETSHDFRTCYRLEFARVVNAWGLANVEFHDFGIFGYCDAKNEHVCLRLDYDRGGVACAVAPSNCKQEFIGVEVLPELLAKLLGIPGENINVERRMSLAAQCDLLIHRKRAIEVAVSPAFWEESQAISRELDKKFRRLVTRAILKNGSK